jgi:uncharacterized protein YjgD (DUF1641 family)
MKVIDAFSSKEVISVIGKYVHSWRMDFDRYYKSGAFINNFVKIAYQLKNKEDVEKIAKKIEDLNNGVGFAIIEALAENASDLERDKLLKVFEILTSNPITEILDKTRSMYGKESVAKTFATITTRVRDERYWDNLARRLYEYDGSLVEDILIGLQSILKELKENELPKAIEIVTNEEVVGMLSKYNNLSRRDFVGYIAKISRYVEEKYLYSLANILKQYNYGVVDEILDLIFEKSEREPHSRKDKLIQFIEMLAREEVRKMLMKYNSLIEKDYHGWKKELRKLLDVTYNIGREDSILKLYQTLDLLYSYSSGVVFGIINALKEISEESDRDSLIQTIDILGSEKFSKNLEKLIRDGVIEKDLVVDLVKPFTYLSHHFDTDEIVQTIESIDGILTKRKLIFELYNIAKDPKERENIIKFIRTTKEKGPLISTVLRGLRREETHEFIKDGLYRLVNDENDANSIRIYFIFKEELPKPDESNIKDYLKIALGYFKEKYGIYLNIDQLDLLQRLDEETRSRAIDLARKSKEENEKIYSLETGNELKYALNYDKDTLLKYSIISIIGSRDEKLQNNARSVISEIVGQKTLNRAIHEFNYNFRHLKKPIIDAIKRGDLEGAYKILLQEAGSKSEAIGDVLNAANYREVNIKGRILKAVESKNPLDYDSEVQICCAYLPSKRIFDYIEDKNIVLIRYDIGGKTLGSAICYLEDGEHEKIFLVDSVEGHRRFRKPEIFELVFKDLIERAREKGANIVVFNTSAYNETSRKLLEYLKRKGLEEGRIIMKLETNAYLEAKKKGVVIGYVVKI